MTLHGERARCETGFREERPHSIIHEIGSEGVNPITTVIPRSADTPPASASITSAERGICCFAGSSKQQIPSTAKSLIDCVSGFEAIEGMTVS
jgi:hypothetical protein